MLLQAQQIIPISGENFPDAVFGSVTTYDIGMLPEYTDDADLFIEYGFRLLLVQEITWKQEKIKVQAYQMETPDAAFGIFSLSALKCRQRDTLTPFDCISTYRYEAAYGNFYISIVSETGSSTAQTLYIPLASSIMQKNPQPAITLPDPFNQLLLKNGMNNLVNIQGLTGLQNSMFPWQELFLGVHFEMFAILLSNPESDFYFARIRFQAPADFLLFLGLAGLTQDGVPVPNTNTNDGLYREYQQVDDQTIYFLQSQEPWPIDAVLNPRE